MEWSFLQTGVLVVRIYGCTGLSNPDFRADEDLLVYARAICGSMGKSTNHVPFAKGKPVWNEKLFFPIQVLLRNSMFGKDYMFVQYHHCKSLEITPYITS